MTEEIMEKQEPEAWLPTNDKEAEWCISIIKNADADLEKWIHHYTEQIERVKQEHDNAVNRMKGMLEKYLQSMTDMGLSKSTKTAVSYKLPSGVLKLKAGGYEYKRDADAMLDWLKTNKMTGYVDTKVIQSPMWGELKKACKQLEDGSMVYEPTGEIVPGVVALRKDDTFMIEEVK